jgi:hypothetical protein
MLVSLAAIGIPAAVLTATCVGRSCDASGDEALRVPFCPLSQDLKDGIANGFREGRSPDVLGVADGTPVYADVENLRMPWPATGTFTDTRVPIVFAGAGVASDTSLPDGTTLDRVAPTVSEILGFERDHPEVRSGTAVAGVANGERPRLVLLVGWKGVGSSELETQLEDWPFLASMIDGGAGTLDGETGSLPIDPSATLTTVGTGGLPSQHGITGSFIRDGQGEVVEAFRPGLPVEDRQIIATLADDLDHANPSTLVGLVATDERDRGVVGGGWYPGEDPVDVVLGDSAAAPLAVEVHLTTGYGADDIPDVIGVVLEGRVRAMDRWTREIVKEAERATSGSTLVVVTGTGSSEANRLAVPDRELVQAIEDVVPGDAPAVAATVAGGVFLDQTVLRKEQVTGQIAVDAMLSATGPDGERMLADAFQGFAVSFARYC